MISEKALRALRRLLVYALPYWKLLAVNGVCMVLFSVGLNGRAYLIKPFYEEVISKAELMEGGEINKDLLFADLPDAERRAEQERLRETILRNFLKILLVAVGLIGIIPLMSYVKGYIAVYISGRILIDLQQDLCRQFLFLPLAYHTRQKKGEIYARITDDVRLAQVSVGMLVGDLFQAPITLVTGTVLLLVISWQLSLLVAVIFPPLLFLIARFGRKIKSRAAKRQVKVADRTEILMQIFSGIKVVKAFKMERLKLDEFWRESLLLFRNMMKVSKIRITSNTVIEIFNNVSYILIFFVGAYLIIYHEFGLTVAKLLAFLAIATTLYRPVRSLTKAYNTIQDSLAGADRVFEILDLTAQEQLEPGTEKLDGVREGIAFKKVGFAYDEEKVLDGIDFSVGVGEMVAFVGRTGVGKTTLVDLIARFHDPGEGSIEIDGVDLRRISRDSLMDHIAIVTQEPFLFNTTIEQNIRYGRLDAPREEIENAARAAHIHDFIAALPEGYATGVGDRGARLSGGERQRITIARAILKNPAILILDEATSSLDSKSERAVQKAVDNLLRGRTTFVIAHRLSTVRNADKIVVLEAGRVSAIGRHEELVKQEGIYRELFRLQTRGPVGEGQWQG